MDAARQPEPERIPGQMEIPITGKYHGHDATPTERASGEAIEKANRGPLKPGSKGADALRGFASGRRMTAYDASASQTGGNHHQIRREAHRLYLRGFIRKDGTLPNSAPSGRKHVDAYVLTDEGRAELARLADLL